MQCPGARASKGALAQNKAYFSYLMIMCGSIKEIGDFERLGFAEELKMMLLKRLTLLMFSTLLPSKARKVVL